MLGPDTDHCSNDLGDLTSPKVSDFSAVFAVTRFTNGYNVFMQLITTKLFISPAPTDYVLRPQLLKKLGQIPRHRLAILSAPAGFGKTTLLGSWFRETVDKPANNASKEDQSVWIQPCWLTLDPEDNDPGRFLEALLSSLEDAGIPLDTASSFLPIISTTNYSSVLNALVRDLSNSPNDIVLVFDDYHVIENRDVHQLVQHLIARGPQLFHLLISTRTQPPFETGKLRVSGQLLELGPADLRFTLDETREYLHLAPGISFTEKDIVTIAKKTEGWIAGLKMAVLAIQKSEDPAAFVKALNGSQRYIFDYLMEQVLAQQPPDVKEFLIATSIVERFNVSLCDMLIQAENHPPGTSQKILTYLERANLFIVPLDDERQWFRYHHLFSELLRSILQQTSAGKTLGLHRLACDWYESNRMIPEAVSHAIAAGDLERAAHMIEANVLLLVEQIELKTVLLQLDAFFSAGRFAENPSLRLAYAWLLLFSGEMKRAANALENVEDALGTMADSQARTELDGDLRAIQAYIEWSGGHHRRAVELARRAAEHLSASNTAVRALNLTTLANALSELAAYTEALLAGQQAVEIGNAVGQANIVMLASSALAYIYRNLGQIRKSSEICEQALEQAEEYRRRHGHILPAVASIYAIRASNFYRHYDLEQAFQFAKRGLAISEIWGQADTKMVASWTMATVLTARNEPEAALKVVETAKQTAQRASSWFSKLAKLSEGQIYRGIGDLDKATELARELVDFDAPVDPEFSAFYPLCIEVLIANKECDKALSMTDEILGLLRDYSGGYKTIILVLQAWAYQCKGNKREAVSILETALQFAEAECDISAFIGRFQYIEDLLRNIEAKGAFKDILARIFAVQRVKASAQDNATNRDPDLDMESLIEPMTERELEILRLLNSHLPTPEIADMLAISVNTVRTHIKSIYSKLGVHSRSTAIGLSRKLKLLT